MSDASGQKKFTIIQSYCRGQMEESGGERDSKDIVVDKRSCKSLELPEIHYGFYHKRYQWCCDWKGTQKEQETSQWGEVWRRREMTSRELSTSNFSQ